MSLPSVLEPDDFLDKIPTEYYQNVASLTTIQRQVLLALVVNMVSEDKKTEQQMALDLDITPKTIYSCRQNPRFAQVLSYMVTDIVKGTVDIAVGNLMRLADNVKAQEILLRIAEVYNPTQRLLTLSGKLPAQNLQNSGSPRGILTGIVEQFAGLGYDLKRLTSEIESIYQELKENGTI